MGNRATTASPTSPSTFRVISSQSPASLDFVPQESRMVAYGINEFVGPEATRPKNLGPMVGWDTLHACDAFFETGVIPSENVSSYVSSMASQIAKCTLKEMELTVRKEAAKVGPNGIFVLYYAGYGFRQSQKWVQTSTQVYTLTPVEFDSSNSDTFLTGEVLCEWLIGANCKAKSVLIILDCSYASGIADSFVLDFADCDTSACLQADLYVLASSTEQQTSIVIPGLGHSIFTYFLSHAMKTKIPTPASLTSGKFPMQAIFDECRVCCESLTSLIFKYEEGQVVMEKATPQRIRVVDDGEDFEFIAKYCSGRPEPRLFPNFLTWLISVTNPQTTPLKPLIDRKLLDSHNNMLRAVVAITVSTAAAFQLQDDESTANDPDTFLVAFSTSATSILNIIERLTRKRLEVTHDDMRCSLSLYTNMIRQSAGPGLLPSSVDVTELMKLQVLMDKNRTD